ncbi:MAG: redox-regulated ATPase YchF [Candidatus Lokiarchaeota archaeon]|nr:redox-regulated ATPase YchF [Candidatus Lokiarchaeota archaeon]
MLIGIVGKPNCGKTTFLNAACLTTAKVADFPFTTIEPNPGIAYVRTECVCKEFNVKDNPKNSICKEGIRYVPVDLLDVAGLVPGASEGKGLGNKFLDDIRRADVLIHVIDASGSTDAEGRLVEAGAWDPLEDVKWLEQEITLWLQNIIKRDWKKFSRKLEQEKLSFIETMKDRLSGLSITKNHIIKAVKDCQLDSDKPSKWSEDEIYKFVSELRKISKPIIILANKVDNKKSEENIQRLNQLKDQIIVPGCALGEYFLRKYAEDGKIGYIPGNKSFEIIKQDEFNEKELGVLNNLQDLMNKYGSTGIQKVIDFAVFDILKMIIVFPVHDSHSLTDTDGNVLPDAYLVPEGTAIKEFAEKIHTDLAKNFIHGVNARDQKRLSDSYELKNLDVVRFVSAKRK